MAKNNSQNASPKKDERNIVAPDQVDIQDIEDQMVMFWEKNKSLIIGGIVFLLAAFFGFQGFKYLQQKAEQDLQEGYQLADTSEAKAKWAADNSGKALSGFAFKELADEAYAAKDLAKAEGYYREAAKSAKSPINDAATIGLAVTLIDLGKTAEAKTLLNPIASNPAALAQAEAQYRLAYLASKEGDAETARSYIDAISEEAYFWKTRAQSIAASLPKA